VEKTSEGPYLYEGAQISVRHRTEWCTVLASRLAFLGRAISGDGPLQKSDYCAPEEPLSPTLKLRLSPFS
jgi:hypothetical protein